MKGLKIFGWICFGMALVCLLPAGIINFDEIHWQLAGLIYVEDEIHWQLSALIFFLAAILSWLVSRALKEIRQALELKMLMNA